MQGRALPFQMRMIKQLPSQEYLKEALDYDPETGLLTWKKRPVAHFNAGKHSAEHQCASWNTRYAGKSAMTTTTNSRYLCGSIGDMRSNAHRVVWKWMTGEDALDLDHIDGNGLNNRWNNLRSVNTSDNMKNMKLRKDSKSGCLGVQWFPRTNKWRARIQDHSGRERHLGFFDDLEEAINVRRLFELYYGGYLQEKRSA